MKPLRGATAIPVFLLLSYTFPAQVAVDPQNRSQGEKAPSSIAEQLDQADKLVSEKKHEAARGLYESAAARARAGSAPLLESRALAGLGRLLRENGKHAEAQQCLERALELAEAGADRAAVARLMSSLGAVMEDLGRREEARTWYQKSVAAAEAAGDARLKIRAQINRAGLENDAGIREVAFRDAAGKARELGDKELEADAIHQWGDALFSRGDYAAAMEKLVQSAALCDEIGDRSDLARIYTSMGRLNRVVGHAAAAIPLYEKSLRIQRELGDQVGVIQSLNAMGVAYRTLEDYRRSVASYEEAYALALKTASPRVIDFIRANLAFSLQARGEWARSAELFELVLQRGIDPYPGLRHTQLSIAYQHLGRLAEARLHADRGVDLAAQNLNELPGAFFQRARVREAQGDISGALEDALASIEVIERMRAKLVPLDYMKQGFSRQYQDSHSLLIGLYHRMAEPDKAFEVAESTRARAFLDLLATREIRPNASDAAEGAGLRRTGEALQTSGTESSGKTGRGGARSGGLAPETPALPEKTQPDLPELLSLAASKPGTAAGTIAAARRLRSVILSYWVADDVLFVWAVQPAGKVHLRRVEVTGRRLASLVASVSSLRHPGGGAARLSPHPSDWRELYRLLILPVRRFLPPAGTRLTIVPHGPLMRLSFAALTDGRGRYLLEDYPLHYAPAAALLDFTEGKTRTRAGGRRFVLVADPELPPPPKGESPVPRLPGARDEVRNIASLLPPGAATILQGREANEQAVIARAKRASLLHFATHGFARDDRPLDSYLALSGSPGTSADGRLTAQKIYGIDTRAELVVLSACRSGGGKLTGEGIAALARAFFYAGTRSLIVSLWDVADQAAERLLPDFYASWLQGGGRIEALRTAQLRLLADLRAGRVTVHTPAGDFTVPEHPILWAGFVLLGEP